jgi:ankyrin repeat protein
MATVSRRGATTLRALTLALQEAAATGLTEVVTALLAGGRADPDADRSEALYAAARNGHMGVVAALLADGRANPAVRQSAALDLAAHNGHQDVVVALLADGRADPLAKFSYVLYIATVYGRSGILAAFLADGRVDDAAIYAARRPYAGPVTRCLARHVRWVRRRRWLRAGCCSCSDIMCGGACGEY